uniref:RRM domain-containing protein n=1 Tax=Polytomella parva TaxID=51329 RepID=A0A7S0YMB6_9CHLO|mmetsp:Transcript_28349/g.52205  ORF Transcript_28349/g.52205 Transcript_28349/m.52205 type:complete len:107 (+) Transcript_28349:102-422(+)
MEKASVVFASNLVREITSDAIKDLFSDENYSVEKIEFIQKGSSNRHIPTGLAIISLPKGTDVRQCIKTLDGKEVLGRPIILRTKKFEPDDFQYVKREDAFYLSRDC